jgi:hypothetical protein
VRLAVPRGPYFGTAIDGHFFESPPCRDIRCGEDGAHVHVIDIRTGRIVTGPAVDSGPERPAERTHAEV